ncbi:MAG: hypothetical protein ACFBSD_03070 [Paracoccaceae bacterium]
MTAFFGQMLGVMALFVLLEAFETHIRRHKPGYPHLVYWGAKFAFGLPLVVLCGWILVRFGIAIDWQAVALGVALSAALTLLLYGLRPPAPRGPNDKTDAS